MMFPERKQQNVLRRQHSQQLSLNNNGVANGNTRSPLQLHDTQF